VAPCTATTLRKGDCPPQMQSRPIYHLHRLDLARGLITEVRIVATAAAPDSGRA
jgi:hypothetical protein